MKFNLLLLMILPPMLLQALTLQECFSELEENYPTASNQQLYEAIGGEEISQLNKNWLPQLFVTGSASYSSETTEIGLNLPSTYNIDFPEADKDRESISLEVSQKIYDAGMTAKQKELKRLANLVDLTSHQANMHQKKILAASFYLSAVLLEKTLDIMELQSNDLKTTENLLNARLNEGIVEKSDVQIIQYEVLCLRDRINETETQRINIIDYLSLMIGKKIEIDEILEIPNEPQMVDNQITRMELKGFDLHQQIFAESEKLNSRSLWPQLFIGGNLSYGKPGYDMFSNDYHEYYSVGLNVHWQLLDFGKTQSQTRVFKYKSRIIQNQKAEFELNLQNQLNENSRQIALLEEKLKRSQQKVELMESIEQSVAAKLQQGMVTSDDYLLQSNKLMKTRTEKEKDRLNLLNAKIQWELLRGGNI